MLAGTDVREDTAIYRTESCQHICHAAVSGAEIGETIAAEAGGVVAVDTRQQIIVMSRIRVV